VEAVQNWVKLVRQSVEKAFYGKAETVDTVLAALLCRGHVLIEDVPGVGKTILARSIAKSIEGEFRQIQCTPDLLPADVLGVSIYNPKTEEFDFRPGPVITNILLVDEINRATPRTQSALLEAMAEGQVSVEGRSLPLPNPFFLIATESPAESEGTFPLPEVQKDRFFLSITIGYPAGASERQIMTSQRQLRRPLADISPVSDVRTLVEMQRKVIEVHVEPTLQKYILEIVGLSRSDNRLVLGVSPRGSLALYRGAQAMAAIRGRDYVVPEDIKDIAVPVLRKRILLKSEHTARGLGEVDVVRQMLEKVAVPGLKEAV
jgi:MoxR-like ATPase